MFECEACFEEVAYDGEGDDQTDRSKWYIVDRYEYGCESTTDGMHIPERVA